MSTSYRSDIDGLRAVAVLMVIAFHAFPDAVPAGFVGVDIFFVISGFLISGILFSGLDNRTFSFSGFYARRIRRIFPALLIVLICSYAAGQILLFTDELELLAQHVSAGVAFASNFVLWQEAGYFDASAETKILLHLWSLAVEEQFYIFWPLLLWLIWKKPGARLPLIGLIFCASFGYGIHLMHTDPVGAFYSPFGRLWELLAGAILAHLQRYGLPRADRLRHILGSHSNIQAGLGISLLVGTMFVLNEKSPFPGLIATAPTLGAILLINAGAAASLNRIFLSHPWVVWVGLISYPLYLWHWPLLTYARIFYGDLPPWDIRLALVALSFLLSWLTYRLIERPIRFGRITVWKTALLCCGMIAIGLIAIAQYETPQTLYTQTLPSYVDEKDSFNWPLSKRATEDCIARYPFAKGGHCRLSHPDGTPSLVLIGDSHANAVFEAVGSAAAQNGIRSVHLGKGGCPPLLGVERGNFRCAQMMDQVVSTINADTNIRDVWITGRFAAAFYGTYAGPERDRLYSYPLQLRDRPQLTDRVEIFRIGFENLVKQLLDHGKRITILLDVPEFDFDPKECTTMRGAREKCEIDVREVEARQHAYQQLISDVLKTYPQVRVFDLKDYFCDRNSCYAQREGHILFRDPNHLGPNGVAYLSPKLIPLLQQ